MALGDGALGVEPLGGRRSASGVSVTLGRATEIDATRAVTAAVDRTIVLGRATETCAARAVTSVQTRTLGRASSTSTARALSSAQAHVLGRASETETARPLHVDLIIQLGRATGSDAARPVAPTVVITLGRAATTDAGRALVAHQLAVLTRATETDAARALASVVVDHTLTLGRVTETDVARTTIADNGGDSTIVLGRASSTETARAVDQPTLIVDGTTSVIDIETNTGSSGGAVGDLVIVAMDKILHRAPTSLSVSVSGAIADESLTFDIDGTDVDTEDADSEGTLQQLSIPVPGAVGAAGSHTVTVTSATSSGSDTFTIEVDPIANPLDVSTDTDPVSVPEAQVTTDFYKWVLQDLMPGGLGSWVMPINPSTMASPGVLTPVTVQHSTAVHDGQFHVWQGGLAVADWSFAGYCPDQEFYENLASYAALTRRFYIIDHRNRAWKVAITGLDMVARKRAIDETGAPQDWRHDYTARAVIYEQSPRVPA